MGEKGSYRDRNEGTADMEGVEAALVFVVQGCGIVVKPSKPECPFVSSCRSDHTFEKSKARITKSRACLQTEVLVQFDEDRFDIRGVGSCCADA